MRKNKLSQFLMIALVLLQFSSLNAQIGMAVSKNNNGSTVKYALETGTDVKDAVAKAVKTLETGNAKNIFKLGSTENTGHELNEGYYVLIMVSRKSGGRFFISYGLGASKDSKEDAIKKAIIHLKEWDWGYENRYGYKIEKEGRVEDLFPAKEE